uniref:Glycosyl hydrolase family 92 domain-containing protein n=1 Tax=Alexandrium catenella TaxID=2925 RepID=A0A7S1PQN2_ALECA
MCFVVEFDEAFESPAPALQPSEAAVTFTFPAGSRPLAARVAVSRTDLAHARTAFDLEVAGQSFDDVLQEARSKWDKALGSLRVKIQSPARNRIFYTALYHSMISPNLLSDADGSYRLQKAAEGELPRTAIPVDFDRLEEKLPLRMAKDGGSIFHTFSAWDTYRSLHPLMNLVQPEVSQGFGESLMAFSDAWGYIPAWQLVHSPTDMMEGDGGSIILATMAVEGLVDKQRALEALAKGRMQPVSDKRKCVGSPECLRDHISELLEQAKSDRCVARVAERVGDSGLAALFTNRSNSAFALWDERQGVFAPFDATGPDGGHFLHVGRGMEHASDAYMEGSALQYSWSAEFDIPKMIELRGGEEGFVCALDQTVYHSKEQTGDVDMTGSFGAISLGNEPTMHVPYLYSLAGYPSRTQELVGRLMDKLFTDKTDGLPGNDDLGQMSSWVIFTMLGLYPVDPCSGEYALGRPLVEEAELTLRDSVKLRIKVNNQSDTNVYVSRLQWNSRDLDVLRPKLTFDMISGGGLLEFWMASKPVSDQRVKCEEKVIMRQDLSQKAPSRWQRRARR